MAMGWIWKDFVTIIFSKTLSAMLELVIYACKTTKNKDTAWIWRVINLSRLSAEPFKEILKMFLFFSFFFLLILFDDKERRWPDKKNSLGGR